MKKCLVCAEAACNTLIDFGEQPICHHFYTEGSPERTFPLIFGQCQACGLSQLIKQIPAVDLVPRYDWISYNEPEAHLDKCVGMLSKLPGIGPDSVIWGLTYKEDST